MGPSVPMKVCPPRVNFAGGTIRQVGPMALPCVDDEHFFLARLVQHPLRWFDGRKQQGGIVAQLLAEPAR